RRYLRNKARGLVLITGSGGALGRVFALEFTKHGAEVVLWDVDANDNEETVRLVREAGGKAQPYRVDVTNRVEVYRTADEVWTDLGRNVTMLVNNAGVVARERLMDCQDYVYMSVHVCPCVHVFGPAYMCVSQMTKAFIPQMKEQNHGHIITVASVPGLFSTICVEDYCASKFAAVGFHESLAHKLLTEEFDGVKTTLVCPHIVDTERSGERKDEVVLFLAPLEPEYCVEQAMNAILIDQPLCGMILHTSSSCTVAMVTYRFMGSDKCMYPFIKSKKNKLTNGGPTLIAAN
uniref:Retinol dehydrogenase 20 n=1 Tax=Oncorhynchus kisutch TaxID=8019 RepID=A0A8C7I6Z7_ONCKI